MDAWQLQIWEAYRDAPRLGRKTRLSEPERRAAWTIFKGVQATLKAQGLLTTAGLFTRMATPAQGGRITHEVLGGELSRYEPAGEPRSKSLEKTATRQRC